MADIPSRENWKIVWIQWLFSYGFIFKNVCSSVEHRQLFNYFFFWGTRWRSWLRHYATSRKVAG
jgi:hypothetical protein